MLKSTIKRLLPPSVYARCRRGTYKLIFLVCQLLRALIPNRYWLVRPRRMKFKIYLNLKESPMMLRRFLGRYEPQKTRFVLAEIEPGMTVVDVGVNKGYYTLMAASLLKGNGRVLSFEPSPDNCEWIRRSIDANGFENIKLFEIALSDAEGEMKLHLGTTSGSHSITDTNFARSGDSVMVKTNTLDNILAEEGIDGVDVMKVDVEGAEALVIKGASALLRRASRLKVAVDIHPQYGVNPESIVEAFEELGFEVLTIAGEPLTADQRKSIKEILAYKG